VLSKMVTAGERCLCMHDSSRHLIAAMCACQDEPVLLALTNWARQPQAARLFRTTSHFLAVPVELNKTAGSDRLAWKVIRFIAMAVYDWYYGGTSLGPKRGLPLRLLSLIQVVSSTKTFDKSTRTRSLAFSIAARVSRMQQVQP